MRALKAILARLIRLKPNLKQNREGNFSHSDEEGRATDPRAEAMKKRRVERALKSEGLTRSAARRVFRVVMEEYGDGGR